MSNSRVRIIKDPEERKQEIIEAALHLFSQKGYEHTTIQDIAKYLNISQGLCYRYFKSKAEIFTATAEFYAQQILIQILLYPSLVEHQTISCVNQTLC